MVGGVISVITKSCLFHSEKVAPHVGVNLGQESHKNLSLGNYNLNVEARCFVQTNTLSVHLFSFTDVRSTGYNVLMVGDTNVGKTSFMKRAQSGKFSLDLPSSVGKTLVFAQLYCCKCVDRG